MSQRFFVTGTDTEVGKTFISCALLRCAQRRGLQSLGLKPVAAGVNKAGENEDALHLMQHAALKLPYEQVNPVCLKSPLSPHIAAAKEGVSLSAQMLLDLLVEPDQAEFTLVEGAGGWLVPISNSETLADFAGLLAVPVVLVIGMRLGCLNHALLTAEAIRASGLKLAAWVANQIDPNMSAIDENLKTLEQRIGAPCLGKVPYFVDAQPTWAAQYLDISKLIDSSVF